MQAAVLRAINDLAIEEIADPGPPGPNMVRVRMKAAGLCGSDVHYYEHGRIGDFVLRAPMILGHEVAGIIESVGTGVTLPVGVVVALEPGIPCGECELCRRGDYNLCARVRFFATPPVDGALTDYVLHPAAYTYVADGLTPEEAALAEPVSVGVYAVRQAGIRLGTKTAVMGAGPVGVLTALVAESQGAEVCLRDIRADRVESARTMGLQADLIDAGSESSYDVAIDCSGAEAALTWAIGHLKRGGRLVLVGLGDEASMQLNGMAIATRGLSVQGIFRYANTYPAALHVIRTHRSRLAPLLARRINLAELPQHLSAKRYREALKTMVVL